MDSAIGFPITYPLDSAIQRLNNRGLGDNTIQHLNNHSLGQQTFSRFFSPFDMDKFGKICQHHWKERLKINKIAKFESDLLKNSEEIAP